MKILIDKNKKFYKANMHTHSTHSDGKITVDEIKEAYKKHGYSIVAFTDHDVMVDNSHLNDNNFLAITAAEIGVREDYIEKPPQNRTMKNVHFNIFAKDPHNAIDFYETVLKELPDIHKTFPPEVQADRKHERVHSDFNVEDINKVTKLAKEKGFLVCLNHPGWNLQTPDEYLNFENIFAVEIYNNGCSKDGRPDDEIVFEQMLRNGQNVFPIASDDSHNWDPFDSPHNDSFGGWIVVNADELKYDSIIKALENGDFYASRGPSIYSVEKDGNKVYVETSEASRITMLTKGRAVRAKVTKEDETVTHAEFELDPSFGYFRIKVIDKYGKAAYSKAYDVGF